MSEHLPQNPPRAEQISKLGQLSMRSDRAGDIHLISLIGELDLANAGDVEEELIRVEATDVRAICLDLSGLTFMEATGIRLLVLADARSRADSNRLTLLRAPASVMRLLHIAGFEDRLPFADSRYRPYGLATAA